MRTSSRLAIRRRTFGRCCAAIHRNSILLMALVVAAVPAGAAVDLPAYAVTDLGDWQPNAINNHGQIVGALGNPIDFALHAVLFQGGRLQLLPDLGGRFSQAFDINDSGQIVGAASISGDLETHAFLHSEEVIRDLGTLGGPNSAAFGLNEQGHVVGAAQYAGARSQWSTYSPYEDAHPFLYDGVKMHDLGTLGGQWGAAFSINDLGQVSGAAVAHRVFNGQVVAHGWHGFIHDRWGMRDLGVLQTEIGFHGRSINNAGQSTLWHFVIEIGPEGYGVQHRNALHGLQGRPSGLNRLGHQVGRSMRQLSADQPAAPYASLHLNDQTIDLNTLIPPGSGWELLEARAINDRGQIVGTGRLNGQQRAFLLTPATDLRSFQPAAPSGLWANLVSPNHVRLNWTDHSINETAFAIWRRNGAGAWSRIATVPSNVRQFVDRAAGLDGSFVYRVRAVSPGGASDWTSEAAATGPPAVPGSLRVAGVETDRIHLAWTDNSSTETAFAVWRKSAAAWERVAVLPPNRTRYTDAGLFASTEHVYRIRAINQSGASGWTGEVRGRTRLLAPTALSQEVRFPNRVDLRWSPQSAAATGLGLWRKANSGEWKRITALPPGTREYRDTNVASGNSYKYRIRSHTSTEVSDWSNEVSVFVYPELGAPAELTGRQLTATATALTWSDRSSGERWFEVWRSTNGGEWTQVGFTTINDVTFENFPIPPGAEYSYRVRATRDGRVSGWSNVVSVTLPPRP